MKRLRTDFKTDPQDSPPQSDQDIATPPPPDYLNRELYIIAKQRRLTCPKCSFTFAKEEYLLRHRIRKVCHDEPGEASKIDDGMPAEIKTGDELFHPLTDHNLNCPVDSCRRSFDSTYNRDTHVKKCHATWDLKCVPCGQKFDLLCDLVDHLKSMHGSPNTFYEENLIKVKAEVILEDVEIQELSSQGVEMGIIKIENNICDDETSTSPRGIKGEQWDIKVEKQEL